MGLELKSLLSEGSTWIRKLFCKLALSLSVKVPAIRVGSPQTEGKEDSSICSAGSVALAVLLPVHAPLFGVL